MVKIFGSAGAIKSRLINTFGSAGAIKSRLNLNTPELWFIIAATFITISNLFTYFAQVGTTQQALSLDKIMIVLAKTMKILAFGIIIYLLAMLSLYFDELSRRDTGPIQASNYYFSRLFSPLARVFVILIALAMITKVNILPVMIPTP